MPLSATSIGCWRKWIDATSGGDSPPLSRGVAIAVAIGMVRRRLCLEPALVETTHYGLNLLDEAGLPSRSLRRPGLG